MCPASTPLVIHGPRRQVRRCVCGAIHVIWDNLNLSLEPAEWHDLNTLRADFIHSPQLGLWQICCGQDAVGLWYGPFGASFTRAEWDRLSAMLAAADITTPLQAAERDFYALN